MSSTKEVCLRLLYPPNAPCSARGILIRIQAFTDNIFSLILPQAPSVLLPKGNESVRVSEIISTTKEKAFKEGINSSPCEINQVKFRLECALPIVHAPTLLLYDDLEDAVTSARGLVHLRFADRPVAVGR